MSDRQYSQSGYRRRSSRHSFTPNSYRHPDSYKSYQEESDDCDYPSSSGPNSPDNGSQRVPISPPITPVAPVRPPPITPPSNENGTGTSVTKKGTLNFNFRNGDSYDDCDNSWVWFIVAVIIFVIIVAVIVAIAQQVTGWGTGNSMSSGPMQQMGM
jgi:hypothetical protein